MDKKPLRFWIITKKGEFKKTDHPTTVDVARVPLLFLPKRHDEFQAIEYWEYERVVKELEKLKQDYICATT